MKKKVLMIFAAMMVLGLGIAALAYTRGETVQAAAACCCCSGDSCPLRSKDASASKDAPSTCPMKSMQGAATEGASCCDCCGNCMGKHAKGEHHKAGHEKAAEGTDSCPMMNKDAKAAPPDAGAPATAEAKTCSCSCCNNAKEKAAVPAS